MSAHSTHTLRQRLRLYWVMDGSDLDTEAGRARVTDALQSGVGCVQLRDKHSSTRTFIANDGGSQWLLGLAHDITLSELAELLTTPGVMPAFTVNRALNLDGGHSSALYFRTNDGREHTHPGWSTVRNYLGIVPK